MELYEELLGKQIGMSILNFIKTLQIDTIDCKGIVELASLSALRRIKAVVDDDSLSDFECVEKIVLIFEDIGSSGGSRHDFS